MLNMIKNVPLLFSFLLVLGNVQIGITQPDAEKILRAAELQRAPWDQMEIIAELEAPARRGGVKTSKYRVFFKDEIKTLAGFLEPKFERGNLLLMFGEDLWYFVKETRRPTRITPIQRLSGSVSYGDLARLHWTKDYDIEKMEKPPDPIKGQATIILHLTANSKGATYQKIKLWLEAKSSKPLFCEVFLLSGKHFKTIEFTKYDKIGGKNVNTEMVYTDHLNKDEKSTLSFTQFIPRNDLPEKYFIKTYLPDLSVEIVH